MKNYAPRAEFGIASINEKRQQQPFSFLMTASFISTSRAAAFLLKAALKALGGQKILWHKVLWVDRWKDSPPLGRRTHPHTAVKGGRIHPLRWRKSPPHKWKDSPPFSWLWWKKSPSSSSNFPLAHNLYDLPFLAVIQNCTHRWKDSPPPLLWRTQMASNSFRECATGGRIHLPHIIGGGKY